MVKAGKGILAGVLGVAAVGGLGFRPVGFSGCFGAAETTDDATVFEEGVVVSSEMTGRIDHLAGEEGDEVQAGDELVRLDSRALEAQEGRAEAAVESAECGLGLAGIKLEEARDDFDRAELQFQRKIIPREQYEHRERDLELAEAAERGARAQRRLAGEELKGLRAALDRAAVKAPVSGVIAKKWASVGEVVQPAQPIYTLYDLGALRVRALFKETQIRRIRKGDPAAVRVDACPGVVLAGAVETVGVAAASQFALLPADNSSGNFTKVAQRVPVTIALEPGAALPGGVRIGPGLSAEVRVSPRKDRRQ